MNSSSNRPATALFVLGGLGLAYPFVVYLGLGRLPNWALVPLALALVAGRLVALRRTAAARALAPALALVLLAVAGLGLAAPRMAALAYPVAMNLGMAMAFGLSLLRPPSLVECFAALTEPDPSPAARSYMRKVTLAWFVFLLLNAGLSLWTVHQGDLRLWTLYNGLLSYVLMGALMAGEFALRRKIRSRGGAA